MYLSLPEENVHQLLEIVRYVKEKSDVAQIQSLPTGNRNINRRISCSI